ncbi:MULTISPECIES: LysR family transcriptional regulator [unclassified Parafrankia]|uniref:LysR family transcriptional regulator n=1 Tax=unclassified Parafrankia TaxID=2994368 RepID=UPI000DA42C92|nr:MULTISPECIES: LysR family transcriptional regulator [unclassified Parafrankia]TCJ38684.1 LysR family transcriptional regulator [Parafrankia sp. BMG5.11]SQD98539.1 putative LysR-family transcriptional regulator [Parafrankia sp. Ea1.12]
MLDLRKLMLLREIDAHGSIAAAARNLSYSRSAVSQQITALEREVGTPLLERTNRSVALTQAARVLVARTETVLAELEAAETEIGKTAGTPSGALRIGVSLNHGPPLLARALVRVQRRYPSLRITLQGVAAGEGRRAVRLGRLDLVLAFRYDQVPEPRLPGLLEIPLGSDPIRVAVAADHPLAGTGPRHLAEFAGERWVLQPASAFGQLTLHACHVAGFEPDAAAQIDDLQAALGLVAPGWAVSLLPDLVPSRPEFPVARLPLADQQLHRHIAIVVRRGVSTAPAIEALVDEVRAQIPEQPGPVGASGVAVAGDRI